MAIYRTLLILAFASCVLSEEGKLVKQVCSKTDTKCLKFSLTTFINESWNGVPRFGLKPLDPMIIPELDIVVDEDIGLLFKFTNLNITGFKDQQTTDYYINTDNSSLFFKTKGELQIVGNLKIEFTKKGKYFNGLYRASATAAISVNFDYTLKKKENEKYMILGPERIIGEIIGEPNVTIGEDLQDTLNNDADAKDVKPIYESNKVTLRKKTLSKIVETAYVTLINNLKLTTTALPTTAIFKDL